MEGVSGNNTSEKSYSQPRRRLVMGLNAIAQVVLLLAGLVFLNFIVYSWYPPKLDLTKSHYYQLSGKTQALLASLRKPVQIIVFFQPSSEEASAARVFQETERLLNEYKYAQPRCIQIEYVDPDRDLIRARQLAEKYQVNVPNVVVFVFEDRNKFVAADELIEYDRSNPFVENRIKSFKGEQQFTSAIQSVVEGKPMKVYFLQGHGERDPDDYENGGAAVLAQYLRRDNLLVDKLSLVAKPEIPKDCDLLIVDGPKQPLQDFELRLIEDFFKRQGRAFIMLDPETRSGLEDLLKKYGVYVGNNLVMSKLNMMGQEMYNSTAFGTSFVPHPIVRKLEGKTVSFFYARSVQSISDQAAGYNVVELVKTPESFWAETALIKKVRYEYNSDTGDIQGPVPLAVAVEPKTVGNVDTEGTRIVVTGSSSFLDNEKINATNMDFFLNCVNWLVKRPELIGISPKQPQEFVLGLTSRQLWMFGSTVVGLMPLAAAVLGFAVWFKRRK